MHHSVIATLRNEIRKVEVSCTLGVGNFIPSDFICESRADDGVDGVKVMMLMVMMVMTVMMVMVMLTIMCMVAVAQ